MTLPEKVQQLCTQYLAKMRQDDQHQLLPVDRLVIYESFGPSNHLQRHLEGSRLEGNTKYLPVTFSRADLTFGWLAVITSRKVIPVWRAANFEVQWDEEEDYPASPVTMLEVAEGVLLGTISQEKAYWDLCGEFYNASSGLGFDITENIYAAHSAAYSALELV